MSYKKHHLALLFIYTAITIAAVGCATTDTKVSQSYTQHSPQGAVYLFKQELDSNNITAATKIMAHPSGRLYLAVETYELYDDVARLQRLVSQKAVTSVASQQNSESVCNVNIEFGYLKKFSLTTTKIAGDWYITAINE